MMPRDEQLFTIWLNGRKVGMTPEQIDRAIAQEADSALRSLDHDLEVIRNVLERT